jgi:hypothetical protein
VICPASTVTLRLHVSGQSKVQTLARSMTAMGVSPGRPMTMLDHWRRSRRAD